MPVENKIFEFGRIQSPEDGLLAGLLFLGLAAFVVYQYRKDTRGKPTWLRVVLTGLRLSVYAILFWIYLDPRLRTETVVKRSSRVLVLADVSHSMSLADEKEIQADKNESRSSRVARAMEKSRLAESLREKNDVAVYTFGRSLEKGAFLPKSGLIDALAPEDVTSAGKVDWNEVLAPREAETRLGEALAELFREEASAPIAGVIVISDGRSNAGPSPDLSLAAARQAKVPIFTVGLGVEEMPVNLRIAGLEVPARVFLGDDIKIRATLQGTGLSTASATVAVDLEDADGKDAPRRLDTREVAFPPDGSVVPIEVPYLPDTAGQWRIRIRVNAMEGEIRLDDNVAATGFEVMDQRTKVLLVAGGPSREYQFLRTLLFRDKSIELAVLLQSARETIVQDAQVVLSAFPNTREALFAFDAIVAIDMDWTALEPATRDLLVEWVGNQAGGLVLVAGPIHTPRLARDETLDEIQQLYPLVLKSIFSSQLEAGIETQPWPLHFTQEGESADFLRLDDDPAKSRELWKQFTGFYSCYPAVSLRPAANVLAQFSDPRAQVGGLPPPEFATQFFGSGRVCYIGSGELWRLRRLGEAYYDRLWIRIVRHVMQGRLLRGTGRGSLLLEADRYGLGSTIPVRARVLNSDFQPLVADSISLSVVGPEKEKQEIKLEAQPGEAGRFMGLLLANKPGELRLQLPIPESSDVVERRLQVTVPALEYDDPRSDRELLKRLAKDSGGETIGVDELTKIPPLLEDRTETSVFSGTPSALWDRGWVIFVVVALLGVEWLLRKLSALA
ncbi:MAG: vWA domain-containing protein [Planctomycetota bacterium]